MVLGTCSSSADLISREVFYSDRCLWGLCVFDGFVILPCNVVMINEIYQRKNDYFPSVVKFSNVIVKKV